MSFFWAPSLLLHCRIPDEGGGVAIYVREAHTLLNQGGPFASSLVVPLGGALGTSNM